MCLGKGVHPAEECRFLLYESQNEALVSGKYSERQEGREKKRITQENHPKNSIGIQLNIAEYICFCHLNF